MPKLIYICEPNSAFRMVKLNAGQISVHSSETIACINQIAHPNYTIEYINLIFTDNGNTGPNYYLALFHALLIAEPNDIVLCNMDIAYSTKNLPIIFDRLVHDMCRNLMDRNIAVILSAANSNININNFVNRILDIFDFIKNSSGQCLTAPKNNSSIIASGLSSSNNGAIVDCYFSDFSSTLGASSAGAAKAIKLVLQMQEHSFRTKGHYLKTKKIKELIASTHPNEPNWSIIQLKINNLPAYILPNISTSPYT